MDILDTVRDMKPHYDASTQAPRRALHREIARSRKARPVGRVVAFSVGGAAVAAIAVTASTFAPPGTVDQPQAASASTYLNETAASIRAAAGQDTAITVTTQHLGMVGGPNAATAPFGDIRAGATGAVVTETTSTFIGSADGQYSETSRTELHAAQVYGDEAAVETAWNAYYAGTDIGALRTEPETTTEVLPDGAFDEDLPVPTSDFPADPAAFLAAWTSGMEAQLTAEKDAAAALVTGDPEESGIYEPIVERLGVPAAEHMLRMLAVSVPIQTAPAEYRATLLEALALAEGITVEEDDAPNKVLAYETANDRYRLTINPDAGAIVTIERFLLQVPSEPWSLETADDPLVAVGSADFLPADIPATEVFFRTDPVD